MIELLIHLSPAFGVALFILIGILVGAAMRLSGRISEREREAEDMERFLAAKLQEDLSSAA